MIQIWQRYMYKRAIQFFFLFLLGFYLAYVLVDYTIHMQEFLHGNGIPLRTIFIYYLLQFINLAEILFPFALLVTLIKTLCSLNTNRELLALQSVGIKLKKLMLPLFVMSCFSTLMVATLDQFASSSSHNYIDKFYHTHLSRSQKFNETRPIHAFKLEDHSQLIYQYYDRAKDAFFDVIWIKSPSEIMRMKYLKADDEHPEGLWVDQLVRNEKGNFEKTLSYETLPLRNLKWKEISEHKQTPIEHRPLSELYPLLRQSKDPIVLTHLLYKISMPLLSLLVFLAVSPYCAHFTRNLNILLLYALGIFGFVAIVALLQSAIILGESGTVSPLIAIALPTGLLLLLSSWKFSRV